MYISHWSRGRTPKIIPKYSLWHNLTRLSAALRPPTVVPDCVREQIFWNDFECSPSASNRKINIYLFVHANTSTSSAQLAWPAAQVAQRAFKNEKWKMETLEEIQKWIMKNSKNQSLNVFSKFKNQKTGAPLDGKVLLTLFFIFHFWKEFKDWFFDLFIFDFLTL